MADAVRHDLRGTASPRALLLANLVVPKRRLNPFGDGSSGSIETRTSNIFIATAMIGYGHLADVVAAHSFLPQIHDPQPARASRIYICEIWTAVPDRLILKPIRQMLRRAI